VNDLITSLRIVITGNSTGAVAAISEVTGATDRSSASTAAWVSQGRKGMLLFAAGFGMVAAAAGLCLDKYGKYAASIIQIERLTGLTATASSELNGQFQALGVNTESTSRIIARFSKNFEAAITPTLSKTSSLTANIAKLQAKIAADSEPTTAAGVKALAGYKAQLASLEAEQQSGIAVTNAQMQAFQELGFSQAQLKATDPSDMLMKVRDRLSEMGASMERTSIILALFGRGAQSQGFLRWISTGKDQIDEINAKLKGLGLIFTQKQLDQAKQFGLMLLGAKLEVEAFAVSLGKFLMPAAMDILTPLSKVLTVLTELPGWMKAIMVFTPGFLLMGAGVGMMAKSFHQAWTEGYNLYQWLNKMRPMTTAQTDATKASTFANNENVYSTNKQVAQAEKEMAVEQSQTAWKEKNALATEGETTAVDENVVAQEEATTATEGETVAVEGQTAVLKTGIVQLGLYCVAIAAAVIAIYEVVKAWNEAKQAAQQYQAQVQGFNATAAQNTAQEARFGQLKGAQTMAQINASNAANAYQAPGVGGYAEEAGKRMLQWTSVAVQPLSALHWFGAGGSFIVAKPTVIGVGEKGQETVTVTPGSAGTDLGGAGGGSAAGGGQINLQVVLQNALVIGMPSAQAGRQLAELTAPHLGEMLYATLHGARH
jgi:hypothetical protein